LDIALGLVKVAPATNSKKGNLMKKSLFWVSLIVSFLVPFISSAKVLQGTTDNSLCNNYAGKNPTLKALNTMADELLRAPIDAIVMIKFMEWAK
jgi:hypothetical protein